MSEFFDTSGKKVILGNRIGSGGEGSVHFVEGDEGLVAKIYHEAPDAEKREKLEWMHRHRKDEFAKFAVWVHGLLFDKPDGDLVGFVMPHVNAKEIHELYSLKSRKVYFPQATWHFLLHVASNISRAFYALHSHSHLMGDVNHGNCVVLPDGTVKLIDCDSFGLNTKEDEYFCEVGVATHLAPELQGQDLSTTPRTQAHDNFGLAVMIFQLLFLGRHPFAGNVKGEVDLSLEECIKRQLFAYSDNGKGRGIIQPPGTLLLTDLTPRLAKQFERAFTTLDDRPTPAEWIEALDDVLNNLKQCANYPGHQFPAEKEDCPWCRIEMQTGLVLFPFVSTDVASVEMKPFDVLSAEQLVKSLENPRSLLERGKPEVVELDENSPAHAIGQHVKLVRGALVAALFLIVLMVMSGWGVGAAGMVGFILLIPFIITATTYKASYRNELRSAMAKLHMSLQESASEVEKLASHSGNKRELNLIRDKLSHYKVLSYQLDSKSDSDTFNELRGELSYFPIPDEALEGFTDSSKAIIRGDGLITAADINSQNLSKSPLLKEEVKGGLVAWKNYIVESIRQEQSEEPVEPYRNPTLIGVEHEINLLLRKMSLMPIGGNKNFDALNRKVSEINTRLAYMGAEFKKIGDGSLTAALLFVIAVFTPFVGAIGTEVVGTRTSPPVVSDSSSTTGPYEERFNDDVGVGKGTGDVKVVDPEDEPDLEALAESGDLSASQKIKYADELWSQGISKTSAKDYKAAIDLFERALEFDSQRKIKVDLGIAYYLSGQFSQAVRQFKAALADEDTDYVLQYLGLSYFDNKQYRQAVKQFEILVKRSPRDDHFLNLGLSYHKTRQYKKAEETLKKVSRSSREEASAVYTLGLVYNSLKDSKNLRRQYNRLKELDSTQAASLAKETGLIGKPS